MTSDIVQNFGSVEPAARGIFRLWGRNPEPMPMTDILRSAYVRLKKAEDEIALRNKRIKVLEQMLTVDELTGLTNRRGFYTAFEAELDRVNRGQNTGGLFIMIDLDRFKTINDTYGHAAGDEALRVVGEFLAGSIRAMDCAARLGGDEFVLMLSNTCIAKAMGRAKQIGQDLNALNFSWDGADISLHGSLGLKEFSKGDTIESIVAAADHGMYADKAARKSVAS